MEIVKNYSRSILIHGNPHNVFLFMDDLAKTGMHMTESSMMMMGSKLTLEEVSKNKSGVGSTFRFYGKMMGMKIDFTEAVTEWVQDKSKAWEIIGDAKIIIMSWYRMNFDLKPQGNDTLAVLSISYKRPRGWFYKTLSFLFGKLYCWWCLRNMLNDTKTHVESNLMPMR